MNLPLIILTQTRTVFSIACQSLYRRHSQSGDLQAEVNLANKSYNSKRDIPIHFLGISLNYLHKIKGNPQKRLTL